MNQILQKHKDEELSNDGLDDDDEVDDYISSLTKD